MAYKYGVRKKINLLKGEKEIRYYAVPVSSGTVTSKQLAKMISDRCTATSGDVRLVLDGLSAVMKAVLADGKWVHLEDIGFFGLSVSSDGFESPEACTPKKVQAKRVCFRADKTLKELLPKVAFVKTE